MPNGSNSWNVSYGAISFVETLLKGHNRVISFVRRDDIVFEIERKDSFSKVIAVLVDRYTLGVADVIRAMSEFDDMTCLFTLGNWNSYTLEAKKYGTESNIAILTGKEFRGALNSDDMLTYVSPEEG